MGAISKRLEAAVDSPANKLILGDAGDDACAGVAGEVIAEADDLLQEIADAMLVCVENSAGMGAATVSRLLRKLQQFGVG